LNDSSSPEQLNGSPSAITQFTQKYAHDNHPKKKNKSSKSASRGGGEKSSRTSFGNVDGIERKASSKVEFEEEWAKNAYDWRSQTVRDW